MRSFFKRLQKANSGGEDPWEFDRHLFIVGTTCSGTTLLNKIISKGEKVASLQNEGWSLTDQITSDVTLGEPHLFAKNPEVQHRMTCTPIDADKVRLDWSKHLQNRRGSIFLEKNPSNILRVDYLRANFRDARFIALVRHPVATVSSIIKRRKSRFGLETDLDDAISQWLNVNELVMALSKNRTDFKYWTYEDLTEKSTDTLEQIAAFGGFELSGLVLAQEFEVKGVRSEIRNMNKDSIAYLSPAQQDYIRSKTRAFVECHELGYSE